ncbi:MAG: nicotinate-nucleotide adenylyltransferase [Clostridia bacterium]|nr:nicotinate-nucleotide adenylyltransferase [Clostridia bacterium]
MKIGIMGGTFNPIHNAHLMIAELARDEFGLDKVIFMTSGTPPHKKDEPVIDAVHRLNMVRLAISENPYFESSDLEAAKEGYSYTADTLAYLKALYPDDELMFIIGSDSLFAMSTWYQPEKIMSLCAILVFERDGFDENLQTKIDEMKALYKAEIFLIHAPKFEISSSMVRERLKEGKSARYMLPDCVLSYIAENELYKRDDLH